MPTRLVKRINPLPPHQTYKNAKSIFSTHLFFACVSLKPSLQVKLLHTMAIFWFRSLNHYVKWAQIKNQSSKSLSNT